MTKAERQRKILDYLEEHGSIGIQTMCEMFEIVPMTARRDLAELEADQKLERTHGGAILSERLAHRMDIAVPTWERMKIHSKEKMAIAGEARRFVNEEEHIFISAGTTAHFFARTLADAARLNVVTDAVNITYELSAYPNVDLISLGGEVRHNALTMTGQLTERNLQNFSFDSAFIGVNAIDSTGDVLLSSVAESSILRTVISRSKNVFIMADSAKIGRKSFVYACSLGPGITLITNEDAPQACIEAYRKTGAAIVLAKM